MCDAAIHPFGHLNPLELKCEVLDPNHQKHKGTVRDYAYPGSATVIHWLENDRRTYHGEWPGQCHFSPACPLPDGHHGECVVD